MKLITILIITTVLLIPAIAFMQTKMTASVEKSDYYICLDEAELKCYNEFIY